MSGPVPVGSQEEPAAEGSHSGNLRLGQCLSREPHNAHITGRDGVGLGASWCFGVSELAADQPGCAVTAAVEGSDTAAAEGREVRDDRGYFDGYAGRNCGDHRTVGTHRAWCYDCSEWCYPGGSEAACNGCAAPMFQAELAEARAALSGALRPQVLTEDSQQPPVPWRLVEQLNPSYDYWCIGVQMSQQNWLDVISRLRMRPVYVISGGDRG